jgi:ATP synthase protein I
VEPRSAFPARSLVLAQVTTAAIVAAVAAAIGGWSQAKAAVFGGFTVILPTLYFVFRVRMQDGSTDARKALGELYKAELGKLLVTVLMFAVGAKLFGQHYGWLMVSCVACLAMNWVVLVIARSD